MDKTKIRQKITAIILTLAMSVSVADFAIVGVFATEESAEAEGSGEIQTVTEEQDKIDDAEVTDVHPEETAPVEEPELAGEYTDEAQNEIKDAEETLKQTPGEEPEPEDEAADPDEVILTDDKELQEEMPADIPSLGVFAKGGVNFITASWDAVDDAEYYMVFLDDNSAGERVEANESTPRQRVFSVDGGSHKVTVKAFRKITPEDNTTVPEEENEDTGDVLLAEGTANDINSVLRPVLGNRTSNATSFGVNLRKIIGEKHSGYAAAQGAATDGVNGYFLLVEPSSGVQRGRIVKMRLSDKKVLKCGPVVDINHGNGMTYDSKRDLIVINQRGSRRNKIVYVDPNTLAFKETKTLQYPYRFSGMPSEKAYTGGIAAIAYIEKFDVFLARARGSNDSGNYGDDAVLNDLWVFDAETLNAIGHINTTVCKKYPALYQSMAADEKYAYFLLSPGSGQSRNIILALDWNSEKLLPVVNGEKDYVESVWSCNNNGSGTPDAVIRIPITHESEGLFLVPDQQTGKSHFYVSELYSRAHYKTVTKTKKVKKKWKKVRKWYNKKTRKWTTKKPKKKYRGRSKKVWKYKYKKKKYKVKVYDYWARSDYVYDLGVF